MHSCNLKKKLPKMELRLVCMLLVNFARDC